MKNGEFCNREVVVAEKDAAIVDLARLMRQYHTGDIIVVDNTGGKTIPIGIITDRDIILKIVAEGIPVNSVTAGDIMSPVLHTVNENSSIWSTFEMMQAKGIRRIPVINDQHELQGILTADDVLEIIAEETAALAKVFKQEQIVETKRIKPF